MQRTKRIRFGDPDVFFTLENQAIDGQLDYDSFPPEEYRYFSQLSKLGYRNRHKGWSKEICEAKQQEYRDEYRQACEARSERLRYSKQLQARLIRSAELSRRLYTAQTPSEALDTALSLTELLLNEPDLKCRIQANLTQYKEVSP